MRERWPPAAAEVERWLEVPPGGQRSIRGQTRRLKEIVHRFVLLVLACVGALSFFLWGPLALVLVLALAVLCARLTYGRTWCVTAGADGLRVRSGRRRWFSRWDEVRNMQRLLSGDRTARSPWLVPGDVLLVDTAHGWFLFDATTDGGPELARTLHEVLREHEPPILAKVPAELERGLSRMGPPEPEAEKGISRESR